MNPDALYQHIGALIRERRKKLKPPLTQEKLAQRVGMSRAALANIETGRQSVLVHQLYAFAAALEFTPEAFLLPPTNTAPKADASELPLPDNLNARQKEQVARLFLGGQSEFSRDKDGRNAK
jgi:transcriptional regulator with XRE-family HTH domain